jgi:hypothetical protein
MSRDLDLSENYFEPDGVAPQAAASEPPAEPLESADAEMLASDRRRSQRNSSGLPLMRSSSTRPNPVRDRR